MATTASDVFIPPAGSEISDLGRRMMLANLTHVKPPGAPRAEETSASCAALWQPHVATRIHAGAAET